MDLRTRLRARAAVVTSALIHGTAPATWDPEGLWRKDLDADFWALHERVSPYTMTSPERLFALREAVHYVTKAAVAGDVVECGVWRGGSSMMAALAMQETGERRRLWLYDTFEGMTEPGEHDRDLHGSHAGEEYRQRLSADGAWAKATLEDVQANLRRTGYPGVMIRYVPGPVEDTVPGTIPDKIALLRLDTDWYESTRHELEHLWPLLSSGGVLIIDDYGHFEGARRAVDEYFESQQVTVLLSRIDYTGRMTVKP